MNNEPNISLYGDGSGEDFPVLKAFQQYIDAEQAKARKRLLTVSVIFVIMLIAVIAIFSALVIKANNQTQTLNDRLVEFAMKDSDRKVEDAKAAAVQEATVRSLNETLERLQKRIEEQDRKAAEAAAAAARELTETKSLAERKTSSDPLLDQRTREAEAKLQKALAQLKAEKEKLAGEKEKLRQEELERYRREHYPEYYAKKEAAEKAKSRAARRLEAIEEEIDDEVTYFDDNEEPDVPVVKPVRKSAKKASKPAAEKAKDIDLDDDDGVEYFKDADSYTIPVEVKGKRAGWRVPLD